MIFFLQFLDSNDIYLIFQVIFFATSIIFLTSEDSENQDERDDEKGEGNTDVRAQRDTFVPLV